MAAVVRRLALTDIPTATAIHAEGLPEQFIVRLGARFLGRYYRGYVLSPAGLALGVLASDGQLVGVLLGALDPPAHYRYLIRRHRVSLGFALGAGLAAHPRLAGDFLRRRAVRYVRGVRRLSAPTPEPDGRPPGTAAAGRTPSAAAGPPPRAEAPWTPGIPPGARGADAPGTPSVAEGRVAEVTHVVVRADQRGRGSGAALVRGALAAAREHGAQRVELVTFTGGGPEQRFYERLGFRCVGEIRDASGEVFAKMSADLAS